MNCKIFFFGLFGIFPLIYGISDQVFVAQASEANLETWATSCQELKQSLSQEPILNLTYQEPPTNLAIQSSWELDWFGQRIPIPSVTYSEVLVIKSKENDSYTVSIKGEINSKRVKLLLGRQIDVEPIDDIFATFSAKESTTIISPEGKELTKKLFGGPIEISQLTDLGYRHTPADLTCERERWQTEIPISIALILKNIGMENNAKAVYQIDRGQAIETQQKTENIWIVQWDEGQFFSNFQLWTPKDSIYSVLGLGVGKKNWQTVSERPLWLKALETALANPKPSNWKNLQIELKKAGMSQKSLDLIAAIAS
jgi:hypothetical protein